MSDLAQQLDRIEEKLDRLLGQQPAAAPRAIRFSSGAPSGVLARR